MKTKSFLLTLALALSMNTFTAKKAEAGMIITGAVLMSSSHINENVGGIVGLSGMAMAATTSLLFIQRTIPLQTFRPLFYIALDANGELPDAQLVQDFSDRYTFIDNQDVFKNLVSLIRAKYETNKKQNAEVTVVNLSEKEVEEVFAGVQLTEEEMVTVKADLM